MMDAAAPAPEEGSKPAQILAAASRLFLDSGYGAVSMDTVARTANVSKATLYAHFRSKEELFAAMVAGECRHLMPCLSPEEVNRLDLPDALRLIGRRFLGLVLSPKALAGYRMVIGESPRFPELARAFYESGPARGLEQVTAFLADADARGRLRVPAPALSAERFLVMLKGDLHLRLLLGMREPPAPDEVDRQVDATVAFFLDAHAAPEP
ncbi:TetR/AcrR family transcriptional regulator [Azospirillum halopraeferens]|uniref:TetR/AcrR family transcriptional regulator n=1 Tax=Azospirillum halopraeferens TaxID=34010 RepID=UPI00048ED835|nr:TetR/AcrR family transcriptional regulator [Azospirillum halopraeferens]